MREVQIGNGINCDGIFLQLRAHKENARRHAGIYMAASYLYGDISFRAVIKYYYMLFCGEPQSPARPFRQSLKHNRVPSRAGCARHGHAIHARARNPFKSLRLNSATSLRVDFYQVSIRLRACARTFLHCAASSRILMTKSTRLTLQVFVEYARHEGMISFGVTTSRSHRFSYIT